MGLSMGLDLSPNPWLPSDVHFDDQFYLRYF